MFLPIILLATSALAASTPDLANTGCIDPFGLDACQAKVTDQTTECISQANSDRSQVELLACNCQDYVSNINCYAAHCWNRVWECAYQDYVIGYLQNCLSAVPPVPYFPLSGTRPDACSCNIGQVFLNLQSVIKQTGQCSNNANGADAGANLQRIAGCNCCELSGTLSSFLEICPATDPTLIGFNAIPQLEQQINEQFNQCEPHIDTYDCVSDLGYSLAGVSTYVKPTDPIQTGTASLSNVPGTVTSPASGKVFTWTNQGDGKVWTVTAADYNENPGSSDSEEGGSNAGSGSGGNSDAGSGPSGNDGVQGSATAGTGNSITTSIPAARSSATVSALSTSSTKNASANLDPTLAASVGVLLAATFLVLLH